VIDAETSQRGFLITGEDRFLTPYDQAVRALPGELAIVRNRLRMRSGESSSATQLSTLATRKLEELQQAIDLRRAGKTAPATALNLSEEGKRTMDAIRALCRDMEATEKSRQRQASVRGEAAAETALLATSLATLGLLFLFAIRLEPGITTHPLPRLGPWPVRYAVAIAAAAAAFLLRLAVTPLIGPTELAFAVALPAALFSGWFGGLGPGIVCILVSGTSSAYYFNEPAGSFLVQDQISFVIFLVLGFGVVLLGDSQRRTLERAMRSENAERIERQRFETTLKSIGDAVVATDAHGRVTFANSIALSLLRWPEQEVSGKPLDELFRIVNEETRATVESPVATVLREGGVAGLANHTVLIAWDGTEVPIDDSAAPVLGSDGKMQGTVLVFRDITGRRRRIGQPPACVHRGIFRSRHLQPRSGWCCYDLEHWCRANFRLHLRGNDRKTGVGLGCA
jgi:PAS domain S-box-containing protein